jgi:hypothetical protein
MKTRLRFHRKMMSQGPRLFEDEDDQKLKTRSREAGWTVKYERDSENLNKRRSLRK